MSRVVCARWSSPSPTSSATASRAPAAFEYVSVVDRRQRFCAGMASGYHRIVVARRPAAAETAPTATTSCVARTRYFASSRRVARNAQAKPIMLAPRGRKDPGRPWASARMSHHRANAPTAATTATDRRSGRVNSNPVPTTSDTETTRVASAGIERALPEGGRHHQAGHDAREDHGRRYSTSGIHLSSARAQVRIMPPGATNLGSRGGESRRIRPQTPAPAARSTVHQRPFSRGQWGAPRSGTDSQVMGAGGLCGEFINRDDE